MISFCTTCHNRLWQLKQTLPHNLKMAQKFNAEICLLNYGSNDNLDEWIKKNYRIEINNNLLRYSKTSSEFFNAPHAKNISHLLATKNILFNLDADNYITDNIKKIIQLFEQNNHLIIHNWSGSYTDGTYGRIIINGKNFKMIGGYDENIPGMTYQDSDLISRSIRFGMTYLLLPYRSSISPVYNTADQKFINIKHYKQKELIEQTNKKQFIKNCKWGSIQANFKNIFGKSTCISNFKYKIQTGIRSKKRILPSFTSALNFQLNIFIAKAISLIQKMMLLIQKLTNPLVELISSILNFLYYLIGASINLVIWRILNVLYNMFLYKVIYRSKRVWKRWFCN